MSKILEAIGFVLIGGMIYAMFGGGASGPMWTLFWPCAVGTLGIVTYRAKKKKSNKKNV
ncbi:MAG TPA: hypothetical protein VK431_07020 [Nitrosopumilaceae archaeon]|nr:hypothetical protein [Nitrosopumilaceae archaeon]